MRQCYRAIHGKANEQLRVHLVIELLHFACDPEVMRRPGQ